MSKLSRKTKTAAIGAGVCALALSGCGSGSVADPADISPGDYAGQSLHVLVSAKAPYPDEQKEWFSHISESFQEKTGATVEFETFATAADEQKKIQTSTISGTGPDIYSIGISFTPVADATGAFDPLDEAAWEAIGGRDKFVPAALGMSGADEEHEIAVPFISRPYVLAYNTRMFEEAGIDAPPTSWDEFVASAQELTTDDVHGAAIAYNDPYDPWKFVWTMSAARGDQIAEDGKASMDSEIVSSAYRDYFGLLTEGDIVDPDAVGWTNAQAVASFAAGESAMVPMTTSGSYPTLVDSAVAEEWAYAPMPTIPFGETELPTGGIDAASTISGDNLVIANYSPNQELAYAFLDLMTSTEEQLHYFEVFGELPATREAAQIVAEEHPEYAAVLEAQERSVATPYTGAWSEIQVALGNVVVQSLPDLEAGRIDENRLQSLLAEAQRSAQNALDRADGR
jgi:multiple sugar transport system substrate-binding protein